MTPASQIQTQYDLTDADRAVQEILDIHRKRPDLYQNSTATPRMAVVRREISPAAINEIRAKGYRVTLSGGQTLIQW
jgi:hypothetical protein